MADNPTWKIEDMRRVGTALGDARRALIRRFGIEPAGPDIVFQVLQTVADIHRRMLVADGGGTGKSSPWPNYVHTYEERVEALRQRLVDLASGDSPEALFGLVTTTTPHEIAVMDSVNLIFRSCLVAKNQVRDWKILHLLACGATVRQAGKVTGVSRTLVSDRKALQCGAIWAGIKHLMPLATAVSGVDRQEAV